MATVTTSTLFLQRLSSFSGSYPSATAGSNGFDEVNAASGDTISIPLRSGSVTTTAGGTVNYGYTPSGNTSTGGTISGFSTFSVTNNPIIVTCANVTSTGFISIWCGPTNGGSSVGYRARVKVNIVDNTVDDIEVGGWKNNALRNTWYYAVPGGTASNTSSGTDTVSGLSSGVAATLSVALTQGSGTNAQHSVNGDYYGSANRTVYNGDVLRYRVLSSSSYNTIVRYKWTLTAPGNSQDDELRIWTESAPAITPPVISSVTHNNVSNSTVTATVNLSSTGSNGTLQYAQTTSNSVPSSGWQTGSTFSHPRGTTRYYWASQATNTSGAYSSSVSLYVQPLATLDLNIGISNYNSPQRYVSDGDNLTTVGDNTTVVLTGSTSSYQHQLTGCGADTLYYASYTSGSSQGSTTTYSNLSHIGRTFTTASTRTLNGTSSGSSSISNIPAEGSGDRVYIWAVLNPTSVGGSNITNSTTMTYTGSSYIVENPDTNIGLVPSSTTITASSTSNVTVQLTGDTSGTQYRLFTSDIPKWTSTFNGNGASSGGFTISYSQNELPPTGSTYTYFAQARVITGDRDSYWVNTGDSFTLTRSSADTDPSSATSQLTDVSGALTSTLYTENWQTQGVTAGNQIPWTATASSGASVQLSTNNSTWVTGAQGIQRSLNQTGYVRLQTGSSTGTAYTATLKANNLNRGTWVVTTASSGQQGQQTGGGNAFQYGLEIKNPGGTSTIIDSTSKIGTIIATAQYNIPANSTGQQKFLGYDCSNSTETCLIFRAGAQFANMPYFTRRTSAQQGIILKPNPTTSQSNSGVIYLIRY